MKLADRLRALRGERTASDFCKAFDIHRNTLYGYESGKNVPNANILKEVCNHYNANPEWLLMGTGSMYQNQDQPTPEFKPSQETQPERWNTDASNVAIPQWQDPDPELFDYVPLAETQLSAGGGAFVVSEEIEGYYAFRTTWLHRVSSTVKNLVLMRVTGDSMSPTILTEDTVMIDTGKTSIKEGMIYALRFESTVMIKRLAFRPGRRIQIISDNRQECEAYEADIKDLHIIGQIIFFSRTFAG